MKTVIILLVSMVSSIGFAGDKVCNTDISRAQFLAGTYVGHQSVMNKDFLAGKKPTGSYYRDVSASLNGLHREGAVQDMGNCKISVLVPYSKYCGWQVIIDGQKSAVITSQSGIVCEQE